MATFLPTIIFRHHRENLHKCTLKGLEHKYNFRFFTFPWPGLQPQLDDYFILTLDGPLLTKADAGKGICLLDGTWRYVEKMLKTLQPPFERRSLPPVSTAYPRRQPDCKDPARGLSSIEALYIAYLLIGRNPVGLLNDYHWRNEFLANVASASLTLPFADILK